MQPRCTRPAGFPRNTGLLPVFAWAVAGAVEVHPAAAERRERRGYTAGMSTAPSATTSSERVVWPQDPTSRDHAVSAGLMTLFLALALFRIRGFWSEGRLAFDEISLFFPGIAGRSVVESLTYVFRGRLEFATNLLVALETQVPARIAPLVGTYLSMLIMALPFWLIVSQRRTLGIRPLWAAAFLVVAFGLPQSSHVMGRPTSVMLHFYLGLTAALILILPDARGSGLAARCGALLVGGLSGVPTAFLAPAFMVRALRSRTTAAIVMAGAIGTAAAIQAGVILAHAQAAFAGRGAMRTTPAADFLLAVLLQHVAAPVAGRAFPPAVMRAASAEGEFALGGMLPLLVTLATVACIVYGLLWRFGDDQQRTLLVVSALTATFFPAFALDQGPLQGGGVRYLWVPNVLLFLALTRHVSRGFRDVASAILLLAAVASVTSGLWFQATGARWTDIPIASRAARSGAGGGRQPPLIGCHGRPEVRPYGIRAAPRLRLRMPKRKPAGCRCFA